MANDQVNPNLADDLIWGVAAIANYIKRTRSATYYLIATGAIPCEEARCAHRSWRANRSLIAPDQPRWVHA